MSRAKPIATFVTRNNELVGVYPGFLGGNTLIKAKSIGNGAIELTHKCMCCNVYYHQCPIIQSIIWYYSVYLKQGISGFNWVQKKVVLNLEWEQIPIPALDEGAV
ncbi:hypothetical protein SAMN05880501_113115 [Ureibacillus xyleni]|uniref:Uncharacterized protein n=1 Tax=Ureibacillus xyleni TaxID=614648 RepID=A0A285TNA0_9BACL|nr:hypothetical protein [Ureibacillus xyleni]SOC22036.1 hypothetical protein SAMN05880501_113115 [Ureibacillus xyleni]